MHARQRNGPGNGYRSNAMGMGSVGAASRISYEGSMRGNRMYNSEYRNNNRGGYGRGGHSKQFQPPFSPPREINIFVEAGRLAAEYLVSKGVLPPNALSGKWQNDGLKNQLREFQGFRTRDLGNPKSPVGGRASAHSRLGNAALDFEPDRRRYSEEYNIISSRDSMRGRRRTESFKNYASEVNRELAKGGARAEKSRVSPAKDADVDASSGPHDEQPLGKDNNDEEQKLSPGEITQEGGSTSHLKSELEKCNSMEDPVAKASSLNDEKSLASDVNEEPAKGSSEPHESIAESEAVKEGRTNDDLEEKNNNNKEVKSSVREDNLVRDYGFDLVKQSKFVNVPTKARSSLTVKSLRSDQDTTMNEDGNISEEKYSEVSGVRATDVAVDNSSDNASSHQDHVLKGLEPDIADADAAEKELDVMHAAKPLEGFRDGSFPERSEYKEQEPYERMSGFGSSNPIIMDKGGKRAIDDDTDNRDSFKRLREWVPPMDAQFEGSLPLSGSMLQEPRASHSAFATLANDHNSLNISLFPKGHIDSCEFMEEKQMFPGSFKTCDLNLVGTCDNSESRDVAHPVLAFPSIAGTGKEVAPIDVDLSMNNNCNLPSKRVTDNDIEVIDLDDESAPEDKRFNNADGRRDAVFSDLDGFHSSVHNANENPDIQDGYGLMISELLGNNSPNSSSVATDINSLHNHMGLPNGEGILGDDDSIYMSLGEIPISLLGAWEQPNQDYGKPF